MRRVSFSRSLENNCWMDYTRHGIISSTTIYYKWLILSLLSLSLTNIILLKDALCDKIANIWKIICCIKNSDQTFFQINSYQRHCVKLLAMQWLLVSIPHTPHFSLFEDDRTLGIFSKNIYTKNSWISEIFTHLNDKEYM